MKKRIIILLSVVLILCAAGSLISCSQWDSPYSELDRQGYSVRVKFDANGGMFAGITTEFYMVDVFETNEPQIRLLNPSDSRRPKGGFEVSRAPVTVTHKNGEEEKISYFLAGWYLERQPRVNANGESLDDYGELCSVTGRPQGYIYSDRFDFENDTLSVDPNASLSEGTYYATLYAAWVPYFNYEFYADNGNGFELLSSETLVTLTLPQWNKTTGKLTMNSFPINSGKTFDKAYLDEGLTQELTEGASGKIDYEKGIIEGDATVKIYTTWLDGTWYRISSAKQLIDNANLNGHYIICNDLDFSSMPWPSLFTKGEFKGSMICENGEAVFTGINVKQTDIAQTCGGIFGALGESAKLSGINFKDACYTVGKGGRTPETAYGLLCGKLGANAQLDGISVSGKLMISDEIYNNSSYAIGLVCGDGDIAGVDSSAVECLPQNTETKVFTIETDRTNGTVKLNFNA